jgi:hypothetical protein
MSRQRNLQFSSLLVRSSEVSEESHQIFEIDVGRFDSNSLINVQPEENCRIDERIKNVRYASIVRRASICGVEANRALTRYVSLTREIMRQRSESRVNEVRACDVETESNVTNLSKCRMPKKNRRGQV